MLRIAVAAVVMGVVSSSVTLAEGEDDIAAILARQTFNDGNHAEALPILQDLAEKGVPRAELVLARIHEGGLGVKALAWCFWAEALSPDIEGLDYSGKCAGPAAAYGSDDVALAREIAKTL